MFIFTDICNATTTSYLSFQSTFNINHIVNLLCLKSNKHYFTYLLFSFVVCLDLLDSSPPSTHPSFFLLVLLLWVYGIKTLQRKTKTKKSLSYLCFFFSFIFTLYTDVSNTIRSCPFKTKSIMLPYTISSIIVPITPTNQSYLLNHFLKRKRDYFTYLFILFLRCIFLSLNFYHDINQFV